MRSLPFPADDLFAGLRELWNARATDPALSRLTVCLLGAALPSDLVRAPRTTPFNVGRRVELRDFTPGEARPFADVVGADALDRVLHWTGGHPFLTQALCAALATPPSGEGQGWGRERVTAGEKGSRLSTPQPPPLAGAKGGGTGAVDALVRSRYLDARARDADTNLADVGNRLLGTGDPDMTDEGRAAVLTLYERVLKGKPVPDDESSPAAARIKMSGVARVENGNLKLRNRIYAAAFDARWVRDNMPGGELRRQRRAFYKGVLRTGLVSAAVLAVVSALALVATRNAARYDTYVASMQTMAQKAEEGDGETARRTLNTLRDDPNRGWEWDHWKREIDGGATNLDWRGTALPQIAADPHGAWLGVADANSLTIYDLQGRQRRRIVLPRAESPGYLVAAFRSGDRFLLQNLDTRLALVVDAPTGRVLRRRRLTGFIPGNGAWSSRDDQTALTASISPLRTYRMDLDTLQETPLPRALPLTSAAFSPRTDRIAPLEFDGGRSRLSVRRTSDWHEIWSAKAARYFQAIDFDPRARASRSPATRA